MSPAEIPISPGAARYRWLVLAAFVLSTAINILDRATLAALAPVLKPEFASRLKTSFTSDDVIHVATLQELNNKAVTQQADMLTWKWKADNVSDVAIGVSDHYIWDAGSVVVDKTTNRRAAVQSLHDRPQLHADQD